MSNRNWLGLLLLILSMIASVRTATAQAPRRMPPGFYTISPRVPPTKQSHRDLPGGIDMANPEEMMAQRLQELHEMHQLQDQVQGLLQDPKFREQLDGFKEEELQNLRNKLLEGKGLRGDSQWEELLKKAASRQNWDEGTKEKLRRWAERNEQKQLPPSKSNGLMQSRGFDASPPAANAPGPSMPMPPPRPITPPEPSFLEQMQAGTTKWMIENFDTVGGDIMEALTEMKANDDNSPLVELFRSIQHPDFSSLNVSEQAIGLSHYLSNAGDFFHERRGTWDDMRSFLLTKAPSLPNFDGPSVSVPSAAGTGGGSWAPAFLSLLLLALVVLLLCLRNLNAKGRPNGEEDGWRLGSWPVSPSRVATRQDVIRAFEYLALLCLGPAASVSHHRELAQRLAELPPHTPGRGGWGGDGARRLAAEMLAWVYEQARYAPAGEALSPEQLSDARHALCLLAGVTAP